MIQLAQHSVAAVVGFRGQESKKWDEKYNFDVLSNTIKSYVYLQPETAFNIY